MTKQEIRQTIRRLIKESTRDELLAASDSICSKIIDNRILTDRNVSIVLAYFSLNDEVRTEGLVERLHQAGRTVLLPVVTGDDMVLKKYDGHESLKPGPFGILEPAGEVFGTDRYSEIDLAIIPGRAFTMDGKRLGRGKGYYDRLLPFIRCPKIGICFPFQIVDDIPCEPHDILMDEVIF